MVRADGLGGMLGQGLLQISLVLFIVFFLVPRWRAHRGPARDRRRTPGGALGGRLLELAGNTVKAVMIGIVGTAAAQALVAFIGFVIAGVPGRAAAGGGHLLPVAGAGGAAALWAARPSGCTSRATAAGPSSWCCGARWR